MALSTPFKRPRRIEHKKDGKMAEIGQKLKNLVLSDQQKNVLKQVVEGKNVFFTGCAGTGKSVLIKEIHAVLKQRKLKVHVTASTGLAAFNLNGRTLHSWAGIGFGKGQPEKLVKNIRKKREVYSRWMSTKILIIDEVLNGNLRFQ
ncbi:DNA helicase [Bonamia ostreae]|uniref:ATP-dependent DNA helicase n=1 Tax=Bonamia ostreae TaxID=126728 RepID=A0ABV2AN06_9EUKA